MKVLALDLSFAKTGVAVVNVKDGVPNIELAMLVTSDKDLDSPERIDGTVTELKYIASKVKPDIVLKEASFVGRASTATPVIKTHGVFEHELSDRYGIADISASTVKAWARVVTNSDGQRNDKEMVAEAVLAYYGNGLRDKIYTKRGKLLDDVADAIAIATLYLEREKIIPTKFKK